MQNEPAQYFDDEHVEKQLRKEARAAFAEVKRQYPHRCFGDDFRDGFIDGYSDFLDKGGKAEMPAMPPIQYRRAKYLNAEGHAQIRDYFLGFKYGMDVAVATGCRPFYTVPILVTDPKELPPLDITVLPPPPAADAPMPAPGTKPDLPKINPNPLVPGLGNPVTAPPPPTNTVPVPAPKPLPDSKLPGGPGGKSAQAPSDSGIVQVGGILVPDLPPAPTSGEPMLDTPNTRSPIFDVPSARPPVR